jgi:hypothetical protein
MMGQGVTKKEGCRKKYLCGGVTHSRNTSLGNPNTINSSKLHHQGYKPNAT